MAVTVNWLQSINWIPVEERLPDLDKNEKVTYVTYEDPITGERNVSNNVFYVKFLGETLWALDCSDDWYPFEDERFRVVAWSKDTVDILPY